MPNFYYNPGVQNRAGELLASGIEQGFQSLADGIKQAKQKHDENKAYAQLAPLLGLDPKKATKQQVQVAMVAQELVQQQRQTQQDQLGRQALARTATMMQQGMAGGPDLAATLAQGRGPLLKSVMRAPMGASAAGQRALAANPAVFNTPDTTSAAMNLLKTLSALGNAGMARDPNTGLMMQGGKPLSGALQKILGYGSVGTPNFNFTQGPDNTEFWQFGGRGGQVRTPATANPDRNMMPPGSKLTKIGGKDVWVTPDGWMKQATGSYDPNAGLLPPQARGGEASGSGEENGTEGTDAPKTERETEHQTFNQGDRVEQNGQTYEYDGENWKPVNE